MRTEMQLKLQIINVALLHFAHFSDVFRVNYEPSLSDIVLRWYCNH
jgi:hypothetical protein